MATSKPSIPKGTRDFGPVEMNRRVYILEIIKSVYKKYGFQQLETPTLEHLSVLTGKYGDEGDQLLFKVLNSGDFLKKSDLSDYECGYKELLPKIAEKGLRYDLTVPFARYVAMNRGTLSFPFKRFQIQPVWRADRPQKGRYREFYQCDADVIGTNSLICEAEIIGMLLEVFEKLGISGIAIKINNRKILAGMAQACGQPDKESELCVAIDKLDKIGIAKVKEELQEKGFSEKSLDQLAPILALNGTNIHKLEQLKTHLSTAEEGLKGIEEINTVFDFLQTMGINTEKVVVDTTLARGLSYYTGAIFEVKATDVKMGSISGGGRYDDLTGVFGVPDMPGVGISLGVDRIYDVVEELGLFPEETVVGTKVMFVNFDKQSETYSLPLLQELRKHQISAEIYPEAAKMKKQMTYANNKNIEYVILAGSNEIEREEITIKDMVTGNQRIIKKEQLISHITNG